MMDDSDEGSFFESSFWWGTEIPRRLDPDLQASSSTSSNTICSDLPCNTKLKVRPLNDSIYELHKPTGTPSIQVLFFHGLQFQDCKNAHLSTWQSRDGSQLWPQTWLVDEFPGAQVFSVSYDARVVKGCGKLDLYLITENLSSDLLAANIGQDPRCPVILVGHCFGGLVIKQLCLRMNELKSVGLRAASSFRRVKLKKILQNVKGVFYYSTPHHGISSEIAKHFAEGPLLEFVEILSTAAGRLNNQFNELTHGCYQNAWRIAGVGENLPTKLGWFRSVVVVREASAREGEFHVVQGAEHFSVCKPDGKTSRSFYELIQHLQNIVDHSKVNLPVHEVQGLPEYPVQLEELAGEIEEKLTTAQVLGIVGMGGVGKTTLAKAVFNNISKDFEFTCFIENVKEIQKQELEDKVLSKFHHSGSRVHGPQTEWPHLRDKKMLLVMDDIDSDQQLSILPKLDRFGNGSRVIITTRDQNVLKVFGSYVCHEVEFLKKDTARQLFCKHAFRSEEIPSSFIGRQLITEVIGKCGGLPLTLEVMGRYLRGHENDAEFWKETIDRLGEARALDGSQNDRVWAVLKVSYDALINEEKKLFTSASTYFFEEPLEKAFAAWSTTCANYKTGWANLLSRCLVKETWNTRYNSAMKKLIKYKAVWVHEHLRDLAGKILPPCNRMVASDGKNATELIERLNVEQVAGDLETEFLDLSYDPLPQRMLLCRSLLNMKQLKYIKLKSVLLKGSPKKFPKNLSLLSWNGVVEEGSEFPISCIEEMENLAILKLKNWQTSQAFPEALGKLNNLCILCLKSIKAVNLLPEDLGQLSRLTHMELVDLGVMKLPESFGSLSSLKTLAFQNVELLKLPESFGSISTLQQLSFCNVKLSELPESFGKLSSLVLLRVQECENLTILPQSFGLLCSMEELMLGSWRASGMLESLPDTFGQLKALKKLILYQKELQCLPASFGNLESLQELEIDAKGLETLPGNLGALQSLQKLILDVQNVTALPENVGQLSSLHELSFISNFVEKWSMLPATFGDLGSLQHLSIHAKGLERLPENLGTLKSLQKLDLDIPNVQSLPSSSCDLVALQELKIKAKGLETLPENMGALKSLQKLNLDIPNVQSLPSSSCNLEALQELKIEANGLETLPENMGALKSLQKLDLDIPNVQSLPSNSCNLVALQELKIKAKGLETLPENMGALKSLQKLNLDIPNVQSLPSSSCDLEALQELEIKANGLETLPENMGALKSLQKLILDVHNVKALPERMGQLSLLRKLSFISKCAEKWSMLPATFRDLGSLQHLSIHAKGLESLPENLGALTSLQKLDLDIPNVQSLPSSSCDLEALQELKIKANGLETLPENMVALKSLQKLILDIQNVKALPESVGQLSSLRELRFSSHSAETLPESLWQLASLQDLSLPVDRVKVLSEKVGQLSLLRYLLFTSAVAETLPQSLGQLNSLHMLDLRCPKIETLPNLGRLSSLHYFGFDAGNLESLPEWLANLSSLTDLSIQNGKFQYLPEKLGHLSSLQSLMLFDCEKVKSVPISLGRWTSTHETPITHNSNTSSNFRELGVFGCPLLDDFVLNSLGWVTNEGSFWVKQRT